jgi:hypothetical protein
VSPSDRERIRAQVRESRQRQGFPAHVEDPTVLDRLAGRLLEQSQLQQAPPAAQEHVMPECPDSGPAEAATLSRIFEAAGAQLRQQSQAVGELRAAQLALHDEYGPSHPLALQADAALLRAALDFRYQFDMAEAWWGLAHGDGAGQDEGRVEGDGRPSLHALVELGEGRVPEHKQRPRSDQPGPRTT